MKTSKLFSVLVALTFLFSYNVAFASSEVSAKEARQGVIQKVIDGQADLMIEKMTESKMGKKAEKMTKKMFKKFGGDSKVDFKSEPERWMWFWLAGWALGVLFYIAAWIVWPLWYLGALCWLGGTICLVIWLLKKFEVM